MLANNKILIVEDDADSRNFFGKVLKKGKIEFDEACDGLECLEYLKTSRPKLVLMDIYMPNCDGLTALAKIRENPKTIDIPVVIMSSKGDAEAVKLAIDHNADDFLVKPVSPSDLLLRLKLHSVVIDSVLIRELLPKLKAIDNGLLTAKGIGGQFQGDYNAYASSLAEIPLAFLFAKGCSPDNLVDVSDSKLEESVIVFIRTIRWKKIWPKTKSAYKKFIQIEDHPASEDEVLMEILKKIW